MAPDSCPSPPSSIPPFSCGSLPHTLTLLATNIAREAGELLLGGTQRARATVGTKSSATDMVSELDSLSEELIVNRILAARPHDAVVGEEGAAKVGTSGVKWIVDPLDGTTNYLYGFGPWAVSIAAEVHGVPTSACVLDGTTGEVWTATAGHGAWRDGEEVQVPSHGPPLEQALVGTGFGYTVKRRTVQVATLSQLLPKVRDIRRTGSAALDLCFLAAGRLDAYYERGIQWWDGAAGMLIAQEAGAVIGTLGGGRPGTDETTWGARPDLAEAFVAMLREAGADRGGS